MARPFCCAKAFDTTSLRPAAPLRRSAWADRRAPAALSDACNKTRRRLFPIMLRFPAPSSLGAAETASAFLPAAILPPFCRPSAALPAALPPRIAMTHLRLTPAAHKNISSILPPHIAAIKPITLPLPAVQSRFCRTLRKPIPAARRTAVLKNVSRETF